jgi:pyruvate dehydrogenase E1 component alpha subunit
LAKGGPLPEFFAELMGKSDGISKGKAGSMHLADPSHGVIGASAVVASTISHAVGAALASKIKGEKSRVFVANFGDGAMEQGVFHESLNFASLHKLPVLFLCEDNGLAVHTTLRKRQAFEISKLSSAFGIPYMSIEEGFDPSIVAENSAKAVAKVRNGNGPFFLRVRTTRYKEHVGPGEDFAAGYRSEGEVKEWQEKDPLYESSVKFNDFRFRITREIESALEFASSSAPSKPEELLTDVI